MPFYQKRGQIPEKRHTQFYDDSGKIYWEELISREGFSWIYSNVYHLNRPTKIKKMNNVKLITYKGGHKIGLKYIKAINSFMAQKNIK